MTLASSSSQSVREVSLLTNYQLCNNSAVIYYLFHKQRSILPIPVSVKEKTADCRSQTADRGVKYRPGVKCRLQFVVFLSESCYNFQNRELIVNSLTGALFRLIWVIFKLTGVIFRLTGV